MKDTVCIQERKGKNKMNGTKADITKLIRDLMQENNVSNETVAGKDIG